MTDENLDPGAKGLTEAVRCWLALEKIFTQEVFDIYQGLFGGYQYGW